jgi:Zn-dependent peptidase ImmA (M78 family)
MDEEQQSRGRIPESRHAAKALLKAASVTDGPVILNKLIAHVSPTFNLKVRGTKDLPKGVDAILYRDESVSIIGYDENVARVRQKFSVAHELGHLHMGHVHGQSSIDLDSTDFDEVEANQFAANLLMPQTFLASDIKAGMRDVQALAKKYVVSEEAMWWQLSKTGLINKL